MLNLEQYEKAPKGKRYRVFCRSGSVYEGYINLFIPSNDNDPEEDGIGLLPEKGAKKGHFFLESEIERIEPIE